METMIMQKWLRRLGHVARMDDRHIPKAILYSEARDGSRKIIVNAIRNCLM